MSPRAAHPALATVGEADRDPAQPHACLPPAVQVAILHIVLPRSGPETGEQQISFVDIGGVATDSLKAVCFGGYIAKENN